MSKEIEFKWGKKRGIGKQQKNIRFYESFTYDGVDYNLYDCVYLYKEGEPRPYIGKLVKIWEHSEKWKKVKVHWFFRPSEISYHLKDEKVMPKELFLASGQGVGLANVNPLEAVAGKCNVICTSTDSRNPQPSSEDLQMADYLFYRTFNVESFTISHEFGEKVGDVEVKFIFNRESQIETLSVDAKNINSGAFDDRPSKRAKLDNPVQISEGKDLNSIKRSSEPENDVKAPVSVVISSEGKSKSVVKDSVRKIAEDSNTSEGTPAKKLKVENAVKTSEVKNEDSIQKLGTIRPSEPENDVKAPVSVVISSQGKMKDLGVKDAVGLGKDVKVAEDTSNLEDRPAKKTKVENAVKISEMKNKDSIQKMSTKSGKDLAKLAGLAHVEVKAHPKPFKSPTGPDNGPPKEKPNEKTCKLSTGASCYERKSTHGELVEVTRRPIPDSSKWFKELPWEDRIQSAQEEGKLVLLQNLDPVYTSGEVEDIIWHAFGEHCTAKMVQRTAVSSPHCGQALVILKSKEAAHKVLRRLSDGCLMLSTGRPLVGCMGRLPKLSGKPSNFVGHLSIDKLKHKMAKEMRDAVSTSHYSQPNTIEYEMAMGWFTLQARSDRWWQMLYQQQGREIEKLRANFKLK